MDTVDVTRAMRAATDDLAVRPGFESRVLAGAIRRRRRRRVVVAGAALAVVLGAGASVVLTSPDGREGPAVAAPPVQNQWLLDGPTRGDLANDRAFLQRAEKAWAEGIKTSPNGTAGAVTGDAHVYWAGNTPGGKVALVAQRAEYSVAVGLVAGDKPKLVNEAPRQARQWALLFGPGDRYAIVPGKFGRLLISPQWRMTSDGTGERSWRPMESLDDTVRFAQLPAETSPPRVQVGRGGVEQARTSERAHKLSLMVFPSSRYHLGWERQEKIAIDNRLPWDPNLVFRVGDAKPPRQDGDHWFQAAEAARMQDPLNDVWLTGFSVVADLPGGKSVEAFELQPFVDGPTGFYALLTDSTESDGKLVYGGVIDRDATLPARVELPDGLGWIVAHYRATLRYRTAADGAWVDAGKDAALLPHNAEAVEVTVPGRPPEIVDLSE